MIRLHQRCVSVPLSSEILSEDYVIVSVIVFQWSDSGSGGVELPQPSEVAGDVWCRHAHCSGMSARSKMYRPLT